VASLIASPIPLKSAEAAAKASGAAISKVDICGSHQVNGEGTLEPLIIFHKTLVESPVFWGILRLLAPGAGAAGQDKKMRIGILTGGGDCPGLNAVIRAIVRTCDARYGSSVVGFQDGWRGLLENRRMQLQNDDRNDRLLAKGGTMLGTARVHPDKLRAGLDQIKQTLDDNGIGVLIPIGGGWAQ